MHIPDRIAQSVLEENGRANCQVNRFGPSEENPGLVFLLNGLATVALCEWLKIAAEHYKAQGDDERKEAVKSFLENIIHGFQGRPLQ